MKHDSNGYVDGSWKEESTRLNQIRFFNQVRNNKTNLDTDGLTTLHFTEVSEKTTRNITHLKVTL